jgi:hypothetical protein
LHNAVASHLTRLFFFTSVLLPFSPTASEIEIQPYDETAVGCARYPRRSFICSLFISFFKKMIIIVGVCLAHRRVRRSIDLTLSNEFRFYKPGLQVIPVQYGLDHHPRAPSPSAHG